MDRPFSTIELVRIEIALALHRLADRVGVDSAKLRDQWMEKYAALNVGSDKDDKHTEEAKRMNL